MSSPRLATIPFEHIEAELAAFPLASEASFRLGITSLDPLVCKNNRLWREAERYVLNTLPSVPPDETVVIRDKLWFNSTNPNEIDYKPISLLKYIQRLAGIYLDTHGRPIQDGVDANNGCSVGPEARLRWSWMCRALPPDFLRTVKGIIDPDAHQFPLHPVIQQMLQDQGFAETHLHLGASPDFSLAWASLMRRLATSESKSSDFESFGAEFEHGRDLGTWLLYSATVRIILAEFLFSNDYSNLHINDLLESVSNTCENSLDAAKNEQPEKENANQVSPSKYRLNIVECHRFNTLFSEFKRGTWFELPKPQIGVKNKDVLAKRFARTRALYQRLIGTPNFFRNSKLEREALRTMQNPESRQDVYSNDPLSRIVGWHPTEIESPETLFVAKALKYIEQNDKDNDFATLFWQVIRIRCIVYRHVIQRPLTPGLQWFVRFFSRIKPLRKNIPESILTSTAIHICGKDVGLRSLEVRLGTEESVSDCLKKIREVERALYPVDKLESWRSKKLLNKEKNEIIKFEMGVLFHFSRKRGGGWEQGKLNAYGLDNSYPGKAPQKKILKDAGNPSGFRFARFYMEQRRHAQALVSLFQKNPKALRTVRGFDLCTDEAGVPVWVMAPLIRWVQEAGKEAGEQLKRRGEFFIPPSRLSIHAGEDFVHLLTGLRRLDESLTYLKLEEGDRLGHALALGIDPLIWSQRVGRVVITREDRLFDLVWEWSCYAKYGIEVASERLAYVRTEIVRLAQFIFERVCSPEELMSFVSDLHNEDKLRAEGFPDKSALHSYKGGKNIEGQDEELSLLRAYLKDRKVWRQGRVSETIDLRKVKHEQASLRQLQDELRRKVGARCLTIEVNPSSNLLIGDLGNFVGHPLWRLKPIIPIDNISPLSICIGSDDPLTFATTLPHEYQLLFDALILMGHSHEEAMNWLDAVRDAGMKSRFTLSPDNVKFSEELKSPNLMGWNPPQSPP